MNALVSLAAYDAIMEPETFIGMPFLKFSPPRSMALVFLVIIIDRGLVEFSRQFDFSRSGTRIQKPEFRSVRRAKRITDSRYPITQDTLFLPLIVPPAPGIIPTQAHHQEIQQG